MSNKTFISNIQGKYIIQIAIALIPIAFCIYFLKHEGYQLQKSFNLIKQVRPELMLLALFVTLIYIIIHGYMYKASFKALNADIPYKNLLILALKRNFISVFIPAGGVSSYAFFTREIENKGVSKIRIHLASMIYAISGFASLILIAFPAFLLLAFSHDLNRNIIIAFSVLMALFILLFQSFRSLMKRGRAYKILSRYFPGVPMLFDDLQNEKYSVKYFVLAIIYSIFIELCGIAHLYIISLALGMNIRLTVALIGYVLATIMYSLSPFLRGLGAVELTLTITLLKFGFLKITAISASLLYRFFEFWIPLFVSAVSFFYKKENIILRILPAFFTLILGVVNIISVLTSGVAERLEILKDFIPENIIYFSNFTVIIAGVVLIVLSAYLVRGLKNAWITAILITIFSVIGHLTKAIDYEEASFALFVLFLLVYTRKNYSVKSDKQLFNNAKWYLTGGVLFVSVYGILGFYLLSKRHFHAELSLWQSFLYLLNSLLVFNNDSLTIYTHFARWFVHSLNFLGAALIISLLYIFFKPYRHKFQNAVEETDQAKEIVNNYGRSALDYFKTYPDKSIYLGKDNRYFVSFKTANDYVVVLETPVCEHDSQIPEIVAGFDEYCIQHGLRTVYFRVDEQHLKYFKQSNKKSIFIGQEGIVDLSTFSLEGGDKKPTRNALNKMKSLGYTCKIYYPPQKNGFLQKLKSVSDEWLISSDKKESAFTQGIWNNAEIKFQVVLAVEDIEEKVVAFCNIIPDYARDEGTYDLLRKTADAPGGVLDMLMVNMIEYFCQNSKKYLNLGMAPLSGIEEAKNFKERAIKFAYENLRQYDHFKGLRFFKDKYAGNWKNKYLVYSNDFDLIQMPILLEKVSR